jgi:hypothetical protein
LCQEDTGNFTQLGHTIPDVYFKRVMDSTVQVDRQAKYALQAFTSSAEMGFDFDLWAIAVRRQMLATLKKREGSRSNWGRMPQP